MAITRIKDSIVEVAFVQTKGADRAAGKTITVNRTCRPFRLVGQIIFHRYHELRAWQRMTFGGLQ